MSSRAQRGCGFTFEAQQFSKKDFSRGPEAARVVRETRPKAFLFENVKGLTRTTFANYLEYIVLQLTYPELVATKDEDWTDHLRRLERQHTRGHTDRLRYNVVYRLLNAANYGVPQRRERIFLVGFRADLKVRWNFPQETHSLDSLLWAHPGGRDVATMRRSAL
ncbi:MAG: DNA cytosine methyltransferase [Reyranella sp.]|nr:DNA cytosine methyltransferase [Reyranella sp.]